MLFDNLYFILIIFLIRTRVTIVHTRKNHHSLADEIIAYLPTNQKARSKPIDEFYYQNDFGNYFTTKTAGDK